MAIKPLGHRVLVRPDKWKDIDPIAKRMRDIGLELAPVEDERQAQVSVDKGIVIAIGDTAFQDFGGKPWCEVGAYVAYARHSGKFITDPETDEQMLLLNDEDLICELIKESV